MSTDERLAHYKTLVAAFPEAALKGDSIPYTSLNGHMFSYFNKEGFVALRLPEKDKIEFIEKYSAVLVTAYGIVQKEYVQVPDYMLGRTDELLPWLKKSYDYARSLKPKPSKSKKKDQ
jgi:hypothetical protein